jgi:multiple sugar transport system substrate-binding protein
MIPSQLGQSVVLIPKGARNVEVAKEFLKYTIEPKVMNDYLKGGLGRWLPTMPSIAKSDPFWLKEDPHVAASARQGLINPTVRPGGGAASALLRQAHASRIARWFGARR